MGHLYLSRPESDRDYHHMDSVSNKQEHEPFKDGILKEQRDWDLFLLISRGMT